MSPEKPPSDLKWVDTFHSPPADSRLSATWDESPSIQHMDATTQKSGSPVKQEHISPYPRWKIRWRWRGKTHDSGKPKVLGYDAAGRTVYFSKTVHLTDTVDRDSEVTEQDEHEVTHWMQSLGLTFFQASRERGLLENPLRNGTLLCSLVEMLTYVRLKRVYKRP